MLIAQCGHDVVRLNDNRKHSAHAHATTVIVVNASLELEDSHLRPDVIDNHNITSRRHVLAVLVNMPGLIHPSRIIQVHLVFGMAYDPKALASGHLAHDPKALLTASRQDGDGQQPDVANSETDTWRSALESCDAWNMFPMHALTGGPQQC